MTRGLLAISCIVLMASLAPAAEPAPNIVIILADDMGIGDTSAYQDWTGNSNSQQLRTPALDKLARRGVRFTDAHSPHSRCTTSRYALLSGRYCWRTRLKHWVLFGVHGAPLLEKDRLTLPEFLRDAGYRTGMVGKWHLGLTYRNADGGLAKGWVDADLTQPLADGPVDHGFDFFVGISRSHKTSGPDGDKRNTPTQSIGPGWIRGRQIAGATGNGKRLDGSYQLHRVGDVMDEEAMAFLHSSANSMKPFFLYFASPANHAPYTPSESLGRHKIAGASRHADGSPTENKRLDFVYQNDVHVARIVDYLDATDDPRRPGRKLSENTIIIFASDNGAERNDKVFTGPLRSNKGSVYEGGHRIPFVVSWPLGEIGDGDSTTPGGTRDDLLGLNDLFATFAEILGRPLPPVAGPGRGAEDSISRLGAMQGRAAHKRPPLYSNDHKEASKPLSNRRAWVSVRSNDTPVAGQWKLLLDHRFAFVEATKPQELYDLASDRREENNRVNDPAAKAALDYLLHAARSAAGDDGQSRQTP